MMKNLKLKQMKEMDHNEIDKKLKELRAELMKLKASSAIKAAVKSPGKIRAIRKTIAQLLTIKRLRNLK